MKVYVLTSFGGEYDDKWETCEGVFSSLEKLNQYVFSKFECIYEYCWKEPFVVVNTYYNNGDFIYIGEDIDDAYDTISLKYEVFVLDNPENIVGVNPNDNNSQH